MEQSDFYQKVYKIVEQIPYGKVTTYGAISGAIGVRSGARTVGYALNNLITDPDGEKYPAHRVVNALGQLTGRAHFPGDSMREKLEQEGVSFKKEYTVDIDKHFWSLVEAAENLSE